MYFHQVFDLSHTSTSIPTPTPTPTHPPTHPGSSVYRISQARILEWSEFPFPSPGNLADPGVKPVSPTLADKFFTTELPQKPRYTYTHIAMKPLR